MFITLIKIDSVNFIVYFDSTYSICSCVDKDVLRSIIKEFSFCETGH